jgi:hypothetical protein
MIEYAEYNGWTNRETWLVNLWLTNEQHSYEALQRIIQTFGTVREQAQELENIVREDATCRGGESSMWSDLLDVRLGRVNWCEIVENNLE